MKWIGLLVFLLAVPQAAAQNLHWVGVSQVRVCPAESQNALPDFSSADCEVVSVYEVNPQGRLLWAQFSVTLPEEFVSRPQPTGLYLSGAISARAYLNGVLLGENGRPGINRSGEVAGQMDAIIFVPPEAMRAGENDLVLLMSSHHGRVELSNPIHRIALGRYARAQDRILWAYAPSLAPLGLFVLAFIVFAFRSFRSEDREGSLIVALACFSIGLQLLAEVSRGLVSYAYPFHETRILLILVGASGFGFFVLAHAMKRFTKLTARIRWSISAALLFVALGLSTFVSGFDQKTALMLLLPYLVVLGLAAWAVWRRRKIALVYVALSAGFIAMLIWNSSFTLDSGGFYVAAALLIVLLIEQAIALIRARETILDERGKSARLELALEQARQKSEPDELQLTSAGKIRRFSVEQIVHLQAAGDYTEITQMDGKSELFTVSLSELENRLPETFLRVHRSHIVNTAFVDSLNREASGVGELILTTTARIPVSRRIMPKVRSALAG